MKYNAKLSGPRLRKITNFLRSEGILPVIATSNGYYVSYDENEIKTQIESLSQRKDAINCAINGLKKILNNENRRQLKENQRVQTEPTNNL